MSQEPSTEFDQVLKNPDLWDCFKDDEGLSPLGYGNPHFLYGVATSMYQDSGAMHCPDSQWKEWESKKSLSHLKSGKSVNLLELYQNNPLEIVQRLELLGVNAYRFSIEWSHIEPTCGRYNLKNVKIYVNFCKILRDHDIEPLITLHHFSEPTWFHQKGSFEKEENIAYFLKFSSLVFEQLIENYQGKPLVEYFFTINEPGVEAFNRYLLGNFSPNLMWRFKRGARFLLNMMKAHSQVYSALKSIALKQKKTIRIGITHQYLKFYSTHWFMSPFAKCLNVYMEAILRFFETGEFLCKVPFLCHIAQDFHGSKKPKTDFVGVQFYGRVFVGLKGLDAKNKPCTTMPGMHEDPEGLFEAITTIYNAFKVPVLISENGISTSCDLQRDRYLSRALYAAEKARQKIGAENMLGYILWSFTDNFEWQLGWGPQFGAFSVDNGCIQGNYKPGVQVYVDTIRNWKSYSLNTKE